MLPLIALGLLGLGGGALGQEWYLGKQRERLNQQMSGLLGQAPEAVPMGPENPETGQYGMGMTGGSGLLADPSDPVKQLQFAQGMLAMPGGQRALASFDPYLGRAIQGKQWSSEFQQRKEQYQQSEDRLTDQFAKTYGLQQDEARARAAQTLQAQQNWQAEFKLRQQQAAAEAAARAQAAQAQAAANRRAEEAAKLEREKFEWQKGKGPELPSGYGLTQSATGPTLAPLRGTKDYAAATDTAETLQAGMNNIDQLMDLFQGKEVMVDPKTGKEVAQGGTKIRQGGVGYEAYGPAAKKMEVLRGQVIAQLGKMRDAGVMDAGEYKRFAEALPELTGWMAKGGSIFGGHESTVAGYDELKQLFRAKLESHRRANPWMEPPLPPGFVKR